MKRTLQVCWGALILFTTSFAKAELPWATCRGFQRFVECTNKDRVAYRTRDTVIVLDRNGKPVSTIPIKSGLQPVYVDDSGLLHLYQDDFEILISPPGVVDKAQSAPIGAQGEIPIRVGPGNYMTILAPKLSLGIHYVGGFGGVAVDPKGEKVVVVASPIKQTYIHQARFVQDHWTWLDTVVIPDIYDGNGLYMMPGYNDVRFIGDDRIVFIAQCDDSKLNSKGVLDLMHPPLNGNFTGRRVEDLKLMFCRLKDGLCTVKARLGISIGPEMGRSYYAGSLTVSADQKWIYIRTGDEIKRISSADNEEGK